MTFDNEQFKKDVITKRCIKNDFSKSEAAAQISISLATLNRIETGKINPDMDTFAKTCEWLGTTATRYFKKINKNAKNNN